MGSRPILARSMELATLCLLACAATAQTLSPASVSFGNWGVGTTSTATTVTLKNNQSSPLTITSIATSGDFAEASNCPRSPSRLAPNSSCAISVTFTPTGTGSRTGTLTVSDDAPNSPQTAPLTGTGVLPVMLSPPSLSFGSVALNTTSAAKKVTVQNYQTVPLTITAISASGDFAETSTCPLSPNTLGARSSCTISVTFTPIAVGSRSGSLTVSDDATNSPQIDALTGTGIQPVALSPSSLSFGSQFVNSTSAARTIRLQNNQAVPLTISAISASGDFSQSSNCPTSPNALEAKLSCTISVTFTPTGLGSRAGTLTVTDDAATSPQTAQLTGSGMAPVTLSPASLSFSGQIPTTNSAPKTVTIKNAQAVPLTIGNMSVTGDFSQTSNCPLSPSTLAAGASCTTSVTFNPTALGTRTGTLTITDSASTSPQMESLSGTGSLAGLSSITVTPANSTLTPGSQQQFVAMGAWSNGVQSDISQFVSWSSSASTVTSVSSAGLAQALNPGTATITATYAAVSGATTVTVASPTLLSITLSPANPSVPAGKSEQFTATLHYSDGSSEVTTTGLIWSSSDATVATVSNSGLASTLALGTSTITAASGSVSGSTTLTVDQAACVDAPSGLIGWWTGDGDTVDIAGNQSGTLHNGAQYDSGQIGQAFSFNGNNTSVVVNAPVYSSTAGSLMFWFLAKGSGVLTGSSDGISRTPRFQLDDNGDLSWQFGSLSAQALGQINFNQWYHLVISYSTSDATANVQVFVNGAPAASAVSSAIVPSTSQISFGASIDTQSASFNGLMDEVAIFNRALSEQDIQNIYSAFSAGMCKPVVQSTAVSPLNPTVAVGLPQQFSLVGTYSDGTTHDLTTSAMWTSSISPVASVNSAGRATGTGAGQTTIAGSFHSLSSSTVLTVSDVSLVSLAVAPAAPSIPLGTAEQFSATGTFSDGSTEDVTAAAIWTSSDGTVATVNSAGMATSVAAGMTTISASVGGISGSTSLAITTDSMISIAVTPGTVAVPIGLNEGFRAIAHFTDGSTHDITNSVQWSSSSPSIATVGNATGMFGVATGVGSGNALISATLGSLSGSANLTVTGTTLAALFVSPQNSTIPIAGAEQFNATGYYSDGTAADVTTLVNWASSSGEATVSNTSGSQGLAKGAAAGTTRIVATFGSVKSSAVLVVTDPLVSITITPQNASILSGASQQFTATGTYASGSTNDVTGIAAWSSSTTSVATINASGLAVSGQAGGQTSITAMIGSINASTNLTVVAVPTPTKFRVDISVGTTGQLFISWNSMNGASYYNLQRSTDPASGFTTVAACSGRSSLKYTNTTTAMMACRDGGLLPGTIYYYQVQACYSAGCSVYSSPASNVPVTSDCTPNQIPNTVGLQTLPSIVLRSSVVDPSIQFLPSSNQFAYYASPSVPRRNLLVVQLPGSSELCPGSGPFSDTAVRLGFDVICVNYSNLTSQQTICAGDSSCFGNISQAKLDASGVCSSPGQTHCGLDPKTGQPYYLCNPADAVTQRVSMMLQYLNTHGYNQNGTNWGAYLSGTTPLWQNIIFVGHSQGGVMSTFAAYKHTVARAINLSAPPQATPVNGVEVAADYFQTDKATDIRNIYGLVSVYDERYQQGVFQAVWPALGFTAQNNDAEVMLNTSTPIGLNCNSGLPSHNFSNSAPPGPSGGHASSLLLWNEDIFKFMLID